jgi:4-amino-4-deoxy-L-arabinose transferase-like glycosyltransferase
MGQGGMGQLRATGGGDSLRRRARYEAARGGAALLVFILLFAFGLRLYRLGYQSIWYDEAVSLHLAAKDIPSLTLHTARDIHPPLYYYALHFWTRVAGDSEFSAAFLSLVFGMLVIAACYRLARGMFGNRVGLVTAFLLAISPFNLWYSQEIRMYTLGASLGLVSLYCLIRLVGMARNDGGEHEDGAEEPREGLTGGTWKLWLGYILSSAAGLYTLYYFAFLLVFVNLFVLGWWLASGGIRRDRPISLGRWVLAQILVLVLYLPWLPIAARQALYPPVPPWRGFTGLATVIVESWTALSLGQSADPESLVVWPVLSLIFALYLLGLRRAATVNRGWAKSILLCGFTFAPLVAIYLLSLRTPLFHVRYAFTYSPPFYLLLALGIVSLAKRSRVAVPVSLAVITVACGYSIFRLHFEPLYAADDHRAAVRYIEERMAPGDAMLIDAGYAYPALLYYYGGEVAWRGRLVNYPPEGEGREGAIILQTGSIGGDEGLGWGDPDSDFYSTSEEETAQALERVFVHHDRVWVYRIYDTVTDPQGFIRQWLEEHGSLLGEEQFAGESYMRVLCYLTTREEEHSTDPVFHSLEEEVARGLRLVAYHAPRAARSGDELKVTLDWRVGDELEIEYGVNIGLAMEDADLGAWTHTGSAAESLLEASGGSVSQEIDLHILPGTPPTEYQLIVEVYEISRSGNVGSLAGRATIGTITVMRPLVPSPTPRMPHEPWANFGNVLQLTGYDLPPLDVEPGGDIRVTLLWRAWEPPLPLILSVLEFRDIDGQVAAKQERILGGSYTSTLWAREELVREVQSLKIPEGISSGSYTLTLTLQAVRADGQREVLSFWSDAGVWQDSFALGTFEITDAPRP